MQSDECSSCYATAALAGHRVCVRPQNKGLETAWNGSGYFRQAMATLGVTLFVTDDRRHRTDNRVWRFPRIEGNLTTLKIGSDTDREVFLGVEVAEPLLLTECSHGA